MIYDNVSDDGSFSCIDLFWGKLFNRLKYDGEIICSWFCNRNVIR